MGVGGRKPTPLELRVVKGKGKKVDEELVAEFAALPELSDPPAWFTESQASEWRYVIENAAKGQLRRIDRAVLTSYCVAVDLHREASERVASEGLVVASSIKGEPVQNAYLPIINRQADLLIKAASEMGLTPTSRSRVAQSGNGKKKDEWDF